jgi:hypothetical protein
VPEPAKQEPPAPPPKADPAYITVRVRANPDNTTIAIDGAEVTGNPFRGKYVADGAMHQVRASAPGWVTRTEAVEFSGSVTLGISLERLPPRPVSRPDPPHPVHAASPPRPPDHVAEPAPPPHIEPAAAAPEIKEVTEPVKPRETRSRSRDKDKDKDKDKDDDDVSPTGGSAPRRPIDPNDPYGGNQ